MENPEVKIIEQIIADLFGLRQKYLDFEIQTTVQLFLAQLSFFQTSANIATALVGIGIATTFIKLSVFSICSLVSFLLLILYISSYVREVIDSETNLLFINRRLVFEKTEEGIAKGREAIKSKDFDAFFDYVKGQLKKEKDDKKFLKYTGEITNFLFIFGLLIGFSALIYDSWQFFRDFSILFFSTIIILSVSISFLDWGQKVTIYLSKLFNWFKKPFHSA